MRAMASEQCRLNPRIELRMIIVTRSEYPVEFLVDEIRKFAKTLSRVHAAAT